MKALKTAGGWNSCKRFGWPKLPSLAAIWVKFPSRPCSSNKDKANKYNNTAFSLYFKNIYYNTTKLKYLLQNYKNTMRKVTSIRIDEELWKRLKKHCIDSSIDLSVYVESLVKERLDKIEKIL